MAGQTTEELIQKAVITTDALAAAGKLNPIQANKFLDYVIDQTSFKNHARIVRMDVGESWEIDKIGVGKRAAMPQTEAKDMNTRRGVTTSKILLTPQTYVVPFEIGDLFKEFNIEGASIEDHIVKMMATQGANDMEELAVLGDTTGPAAVEGDIVEGGHATQVVKDSFLATQDGYLRLADSGNIYDHAAAAIGVQFWGGMIRKLPTKFRRNYSKLRFFVSPDMAQLWREKTAARGTPLGDSVLGASTELKPFGIPMIEAPLMPFYPKVVEHVTLTGTTPASLRYAPIVAGTEIVTLSALGATPTTKYIPTTDYVIDAAAGTIARNGGGAIQSGATVKVTYEANPQALLTHEQNLIVAISRDVRIEKDRDIYRGVNKYAITMKMAFKIEEATAIVKGKNCSASI